MPVSEVKHLKLTRSDFGWVSMSAGADEWSGQCHDYGWGILFKSEFSSIYFKQKNEILSKEIVLDPHCGLEM